MNQSNYPTTSANNNATGSLEGYRPSTIISTNNVVIGQNTGSPRASFIDDTKQKVELTTEEEQRFYKSVKK